MRALQLYQKKFPSMDSKFSNHEIRFVTGDQNELPYKEVFAVIGKLTSDWAVNEVKDYDDLKLVYISPGASNPGVTSGKKYVFSMNFNDTMQGRMIARFLRYVRKCQSVAVVYDEKDYSNGLRRGFLQGLFTSYHPVKLDTSMNFPMDFVRERLKPLWENKKPVDAIVILLESQECATLTKELLDQRFKNLIVCPESCFKQSFIDKVGEDHFNICVATPLVEGFGTKKDLEFRNEFLRNGGKEVPLWSVFAYEAIDLLMQTHLAHPKPQNNRQESARIRRSFEHMRSIDSAKISLSGPLFFEESGFISRPVIITHIDGGKFRPVSMQIQDRVVVAGGSEKKIIAKMTDREEAVPTEKSPDGGAEYLIKVPVVFTKVQVDQLSEFDAVHESVKIDYEIYTKWPKDFDPKSEWAAAVNILSPSVIGGPKDEQVSQTEKTDPTRSDQAKKSDHEKCWKGKATIHWQPDLRLFPLDCQSLRLLVGYYGDDPLKVMLAVDSETGKHPSAPKVLDQFDAMKCPTCSDRTYLHVPEKGETPSLTIPWTGKALTRKYPSVYELQFVLRRKPLYSIIVLLPLVIAAVAWLGVGITDRYPGIDKAIPRIAVIALIAMYGFLVLPYKVPFLSLANGCFLGAGLVLIVALSRSWTDIITPWLRRFAFVLLAANVVVAAVFWIQWMRAWTLCQ